MSPKLLATLLAFLVPLFSFLYILCGVTFSKNRQKLPPGPRTLPIIGNLHILGDLPHQTLYHLAKKYGDILSIRLGFVPTIVVSSPRAAELFLKTHDTNFASRPYIQASFYMSYKNKGMAFSHYGPYWRHVRKLCTLQLFSASKIEEFSQMRKEELGLTVDSLKKSAFANDAVNISLTIGKLIQSMTCRMVFGRNLEGEMDLEPLVKECLVLVGAFNLSDYVPFLAPFDLQGLTRRMKAFSKAMDKVLEKIIVEHEQTARWQKHQETDFIDVLLSLMNQPINPNDPQVCVIDRSNIKAIILDMIVGSLDTSATTLAWIFSELLRHPQVMRRVQEELKSVVGMNRMVEEKDLPKLTYMDMVIKESLRLHPTAPLLVPRESIEDVIIDKHQIPKKSRIIINAWAIGRDTDVWSNNALEFLPERFKDTNVDLLGHDFQLIPFGSGRRGCPGMQLGLVTVRLVLAQLIHCFNWELPNGMLPSDLDMNEKFGLALERASHLLGVPTYRLLSN